ncbi:MAG: hypothetical protein CVT49_10445 [candidate division Zixibacteria bacterium HGW-Zixibacteria-1]|nr:MAG: hypothetical protein CVT49_10445 [candidate division Zixibacteria bacterium HGW-Zixibacteria-1]
MKRIIVLAALSILCMVVNFCVNCSNPLDIENVAPPSRFTGVDTIYNLDTLNTSDTTIIVDTVIVVVHDTTGSQIICSRIDCNQKEIVWMFRNAEGSHKLEFVAFTEEDQPCQKLVVDVDGQEFSWKPVENPELIMEQDLNQNATIRISSTNPKALGHAIYICLTLSSI